MKKNLFIFIFIVTIVFTWNCSIFNTDSDVPGTYFYTGIFLSQKLFIDTTNTSAGDTTITGGTILLSWSAFSDINGDSIAIEKSVDNNTSYSFEQSVPVSQSGTFIDSILSGNDYYYKLTLYDNGVKKIMNEYSINVPQLTFSSPSIVDTNLPPTGFSIKFDNVNDGKDYKISIKDVDRNEIWAKTVTSNDIVYDGDSLITGIYLIEVSTTIQDLQNISSIVTTTGLSQFYIK